MSVRDIIVRILADDQTKKGLNSAATNMSKMESAASSLVKRLAGLATVGTFTALIKSSIDAASQLDDMSKKFGVSAEALSQLQFVAKMSGVELEALGNAFKFLSKNISEAENPASDAALAFEMVGIKLSDMKGKTSDEVFLMLAERFSQMEDGANKTALALAIFGRAGADILPVLAEGADGIKKMREEAVRTGAALSADEIAKLDAYGDAMDKVGMIAKNTAGRILMDVIGAIDALWKKVEEKGPRLERFFAKVFGGDVAAVEAKNLAEGHTEEDVTAGGEYKPKTKPGSIEAAKAARKGDKKGSEEAEQKKRAEDEARGWGAVAEEQVQLAFDTAKTISDLQKKEVAEQEARMEYIQQKRQENAEEEVEDQKELIQKNYDTWLAAEQAKLEYSEYEEKLYAVSDLYAKVFRGADGMIADLADTAINAFDGMTDALVDFAMTGEIRFKEFADSVIADLMRIAVRQSVVQPLAQGLLGAFGFSIAGKASGGPVVGGVPYMVGERGPEVFVPSSSGGIIPNGAGGSNNVSVNIRNESGQPVEARAARASFNAQGWVIDVVLDGISRNVRGIRTALGGA